MGNNNKYNEKDTSTARTTVNAIESTAHRRDIAAKPTTTSLLTTDLPTSNPQQVIVPSSMGAHLVDLEEMSSLKHHNSNETKLQRFLRPIPNNEGELELLEYLHTHAPTYKTIGVDTPSVDQLPIQRPDSLQQYHRPSSVSSSTVAAAATSIAGYPTLLSPHSLTISTPTQTPTNPPEHVRQHAHTSSSNEKWKQVGIVAGVVVLLVLALVFAMVFNCWCKRARGNKGKLQTRTKRKCKSKSRARSKAKTGRKTCIARGFSDEFDFDADADVEAGFAACEGLQLQELGKPRR